jgi:hypothetical protein
MSMQAPFRPLDPGSRPQARSLSGLQPPYSTAQHWRLLHHLSMRLLTTRLCLMLSSSGQICGQRENSVVIGYIIGLLISVLLNATFEAFVAVMLKI